MSAQLINQVIELTNAERAKAKLPLLKENSQLVDAAQDHSDDMANDDFFSHRGVDGSTLGNRIQDSGYQYLAAGENIAAGQTTAEQVVEGWMNSPGHRANILNPNFTEIGIGYAFLKNDTGSVNYNHYWTQVFGTPRNNNNNNSSQDFNSELLTQENINHNVTGKSDTSVLTGGKDAIDFSINQGAETNNQFTNLTSYDFPDLFSNSWLGNATDRNFDYETIDIAEYISNLDSEENKQNLIRENPDSFI